MIDYISNCPVSGPIHLPHITPDVDFNGVMWSYQYGLVFSVPEDEAPIRKPIFPQP